MKNDDHNLKRPLERVAEAAGLDPATAQAVVEATLRELDAAGVIHYAPKEALALLSPVGRVMCLVAEYPDATTRELGTRLGVSESFVGAQITRLVKAGLIKRTRVTGRNWFKVDWEKLRAHPDLTHFAQAFHFEPSASAPEYEGSGER